MKESAPFEELETIPSAESNPEKIEGVIKKLKESFPSLEHTLEIAKGHIKIFSVAAMLLTSAEAGAQQVRDDSSGVEKSRIVSEIQNLPLNKIMEELSKYKFHLPVDHKTAVLNQVEEKDALPIVKKVSGSLIETNGSLGNLGVLLSDRHIRRSIQTLKDTFDEKLESISSSSVEITEPLDVNMVESTGGTIRATGLGQSREEAIIEAVKELSMTEQVHILNLVAQTKESEGVNVHKETTTATAIDAVNYLKSVHIISVEEVKVLDQIYFQAKLEAQTGRAAQAANPLP